MTAPYVAPANARPVGVTILAILQMLIGLIGLCLPTLLLIGGSLLTALLALLGPLGAAAGGVGILFILVGFLGPVLHLIVAYGAFNLKHWAWWLGVIATGVDVFVALLNLWNGSGFLHILLTTGFSILVFIYLLTPGVRKAFDI